MSGEFSQNVLTGSELIEVYISSMLDVAHDVRMYTLTVRGQQVIPDFAAGAHIDLYLPNGLIRSYSICNRHPDSRSYLIAIQKDPDSKGGSRYIHEHLICGQTLHISNPRNHFPLDEDGRHTIMIAGGIGITPFRSMIYRLQELKRSWQLYYCVRSRDRVVFFDEWQTMADNIHICITEETGDERLSIESIVANVDKGAHFYCCGPQRMLTDFERVLSDIPSKYVHLEYFNAKTSSAVNGAFEVELARTGKSLQIGPDQSILDAVLAAGVQVSHACSEGVCGACETNVLCGIPDHRDTVLSFDEQSAGKKILICCSRSKSERLVLDL